MFVQQVVSQEIPMTEDISKIIVGCENTALHFKGVSKHSVKCCNQLSTLRSGAQRANASFSGRCQEIHLLSTGSLWSKSRILINNKKCNLKEIFFSQYHETVECYRLKSFKFSK